MSVLATLVTMAVRAGMVLTCFPASVLLVLLGGCVKQVKTSVRRLLECEQKYVNIIEYTLIKYVCRSNINVFQFQNGFITCLSQNTVDITHGITFKYSTVFLRQ